MNNSDYCDHCYTRCGYENSKLLNLSQIDDPWEGLPKLGNYCQKCYQKLSFKGSIYRVNHKSDSFDHIKYAIDNRLPFLWDISPFSGSEAIDLEPLFMPYFNDTDAMIHIIENICRFDKKIIYIIWDKIKDVCQREWFEDYDDIVWEEVDDDTINHYPQLDLVKILTAVKVMDKRLFDCSMAYLRPSHKIVEQLDQVTYKFYALGDLLKYIKSKEYISPLKYAEKSVKFWERYASSDKSMEQLVPWIKSCYRFMCEDSHNDHISHFWITVCQCNPKSYFT